MAKRSDPADDPADHDDIPELDEIVAAPAPAGAVPPPNFDLFADAGLDLEALRDTLADRLGEEIDAALAELRAEFEEALRTRVEARLRERLPEILDTVLRGERTPDAE